MLLSSKDLEKESTFCIAFMDIPTNLYHLVPEYKKADTCYLYNAWLIQTNAPFPETGGACGYGEYGRDVNDGNVAAVHRPYRNGTGCGACYQVKCKAGGCTDEGVMVVATDFGIGDWTDFIFPAQVYSKMAQTGFEGELLSYGVVDIEYRRVACDFGGSTLVVKVHEATKYPHYLAIIIVYTPGVYEVVAAQIWQEDCKTWRAMRKPYGAVWDMENPPKGGQITFKFLLSATGSVDDGEWMESPTFVSTSLQAGATFDTGIQL